MNRNRLWVVIAAALLAVAALSVFSPDRASAQGAYGGVEITLDGSAAKALKRAKVRWVAIEPAAASRTKWTLPATTATIDRAARARHAGVIQLVRGKGRSARRVAITGARTQLMAKGSGIRARVGTKRLQLLRFAFVRPTLNSKAGSARMPKASVSLTRESARAITRALGIDRLRVRRLGTATVAITRPGAAPPSAPGPMEPAPNRPPAVGGNISAASFTWRPRESWIRYVNAGEDAEVIVSEGATEGPREVRPCPPESTTCTDAPLVYSFNYPFTGGNSDASGTRLGFSGRVTFKWPSRGIDLQYASPQLQIGGQSSAYFVLGGATSGGRNGQLIRVLDLDPSKAKSRTVEGNTESYTEIPATLTEEGAASFGDFYQAGQEFGYVTTSYTRTP